MNKQPSSVALVTYTAFDLNVFVCEFGPNLTFSPSSWSIPALPPTPRNEQSTATPSDKPESQAQGHFSEPASGKVWYFLINQTAAALLPHSERYFRLWHWSHSDWGKTQEAREILKTADASPSAVGYWLHPPPPHTAIQEWLKVDDN